MTCKLEQSENRIVSLDNLLEYFKYLDTLFVYDYDDFSRILNIYKYYLNKYNIIVDWASFDDTEDLNLFLTSIILNHILENDNFYIDGQHNIDIYHSQEIKAEIKYMLKKFAENCRYNINFK